MDDQFLEELYASYQGDSFAGWLKGAVEKYGDLATAEKIIDDYTLRNSGSEIPGTIGFCVNYWSILKREFDKLVCGQEPYKKENQEYYVLGKFFSLATASSMATSISIVVNIPIYILTPTIALMLHFVMKMTRKAYCCTIQL